MASGAWNHRSTKELELVDEFDTPVYNMLYSSFGYSTGEELSELHDLLSEKREWIAGSDYGEVLDQLETLKDRFTDPSFQLWHEKGLEEYAFERARDDYGIEPGVGAGQFFNFDAYRESLKDEMTKVEMYGDEFYHL